MSENSPAGSAGVRDVQTQDEILVSRLHGPGLNGVTLPPGGVSTRPAPRQGSAQEHLQAVPRPEYFTRDGRDLRLDLIRGFFVLAMVIDHVRSDSPLYLLTGGNRFFTSAAEGFILISGLVTGLVYKRIIQREGMSAGLLKVLKRAFTLYILTVAVTLGFSLFSELTGMHWATGVDFSNPLGFVISVLTLHQTYYLIDVMLLYTVLFLVTPLAFVLLDRGKVWVLLAGSWLLYALYQFFPNIVTLPWPITGNYLFNFSSWQVIFFSALTLGYLQDRLPVLGRRATRIALLATGAATVLLIIGFVVIDLPDSWLAHVFTGQKYVIDPNIRNWLDDYLFSKADVRPGRLIASAVTYSFLFFLVSAAWRQVKKITGWLLLTLGKSALYAYTVHIVVASLIGLALKPFNIAEPGPQWLNAVLQIAAILVVWFMVLKQPIRPTERTRLVWNTSPVLMGVIIVALLWQFPIAPPANAIASAQVDSNSVSPASSAARRYGTPAPKGSEAQPIVRSTPTPAPASASAAADTAVSHPMILGGTDLLSSPYLDKTNGSVHERWFYSQALNQDMPYYIYLPPNYATVNKRFPVMYMLHGLGGHREEWLVYGLINVIDHEISIGNIQPVIIVLPQGDKEYWVNHASDGQLWGDYVDYDLVAHIDSTFRTIRAPASRAIGGLSMGGFGALYHAFTHPEIFGVVGAHSASLRPDDGTLDFLASGGAFNQIDPVHLAATAPNLDKLQIWIDVGVEDETWLPRSTELHQALLDRGISHIWQTPAGGHDYNYWTDNMLDYVNFYTHALVSG
jgi:enterochelin esterase-like enzyme